MYMSLAEFWEEFQEAAEDDRVANERAKQQQRPIGVKRR